ncbi:MAG TPA: DUF2279 domain-containing protein [Thermoanaerobaculia bacterium]
MAQEFRLFPEEYAARDASTVDAQGPSGFHLADLEMSSPWAGGTDAGTGDVLRLSGGAGEEPAPETAPAAPERARRCVLVDCVALPIDPTPPARLFTKPVTLWTSTALFFGFVDGIQGPIQYGFSSFHFTNERFFQSDTYAGGADKASHFVISANVGGLLYDAYRLHGLSEDQAFWLSLGAMVVSGTLVEIGDGLTPYGFSAQDLMADTAGALVGTLLKREHLDDLIGVRIGEVPTRLPAEVFGDSHESFGGDYSHEMYTADLKLPGLFHRAGADPGLARYFLFSFAYLTKGYGYAPPIPSRYQQVGFELGLNFPEILRAVGVNETTWWGDTLLRAFGFLRIPFTQIGAYYNLTNQKWYGPGAPYHYY